MDIETFKKKCKAKKDKHDEQEATKKKKLDERKAEFMRIKESQKQYDTDCYEPRWAIFGKPKCPVCGKPLNREIVEKRKSEGMGLLDFDYDIIYTCDCGYEYAETK